LAFLQYSIKDLVSQSLDEKYQGLINSQSKVTTRSFVSSTILFIFGLLFSRPNHKYF